LNHCPEITLRNPHKIGLALGFRGCFFVARSFPGAGHDAQMIARIAPMGMIFVPSVSGISHSPKELTRWEDVANGCEVLYRMAMAIDKRP
jgi:hypothetical protein